MAMSKKFMYDGLPLISSLMNFFKSNRVSFKEMIFKRRGRAK